MKKMSWVFLLSFLFTVFFLNACKTKPAPALIDSPSAFLSFEKIEADDPVHLRLFFSAEVTNPHQSGGQVKIESWRVEINGKRANYGFDLEGPLVFHLRSGHNSFPLKMNMDIDALAAQGLAPADEYCLNLIAKLSYIFDSAPPSELEVSGIAVFPGIQAPTFSITAIAILKAELVNTRFRVSLKIDNPNPFPVDLAAFSYELFGNGRLWADGMERNIISVPGKSSLRGDLFLLMNFINMRRNLLDQIINLVDVNYRFTGEAQVSTEVEYLPKFTTSFELSGYSEVLEN